MHDENREPHVETLHLKADLDRHAVEALKLEIRHLAKRHHVQIVDVRIEKEPPPSA